MREERTIRSSMHIPGDTTALIVFVMLVALGALLFPVSLPLSLLALFMGGVGVVGVLYRIVCPPGFEHVVPRSLPDVPEEPLREEGGTSIRGSPTNWPARGRWCECRP